MFVPGSGAVHPVLGLVRQRAAVHRAALPPALVLPALAALALGGVVALPSAATAVPRADVRITELAYGGGITSADGDGEYVEITNVGTSDVDLGDWTYTVDAQVAPLTDLAVLAAGESALITDVTPAELRAEWGLKDSVKVVSNGGVTLNKGPKTLAISDGDGNRVDELTYASGFLPGKGASAWVDAAHLGAATDTTGWTISSVDDAEESWPSASGSVGSPGASTFGVQDAAAVRTGTDDDGSTPPATDPHWADIVINEVTSDNDGFTTSPLPDLSDGIELFNTGTHDVDVTGWKQIDSGAAGAAAVFSGGLYVDGVLSTVIPAGGYGVFQSTKGLGSGGDAVKVYTPDGTLVDEVAYLAGQAGEDEAVNTDHTYRALARCLDGEDTWLEVTTATFGSSNDSACATGVPPLTGGAGPEAACDTEDAGSAPGTVPAGAATWPGSATPVAIDAVCAWVTSESGQDLSGLAFDPKDADVLYAVKNKSHVWRLLRDGDAWVPDTALGWSTGKDLRFPDGGGMPDSEGVTVGPDGAVYVTTERDNDASGVPLDSVLRFDPTTSATTLIATDQWLLTDDLGFAPGDSADANLGFEGLAHVPDAFLVREGFRTDSGELYDPAAYPGAVGGGLFLGAVEKTGHLRAYVLKADHTSVRVADIASGLAGVMDASFDADLGALWAHCDNTCGNATALLAIGADGRFTVDRTYLRPAGLPNYNLEGFAVAPASTAVDGQRQVLWADDGNRFGHSLWAGTLPVDLGPVGGGSDDEPGDGSGDEPGEGSGGGSDDEPGHGSGDGSDGEPTTPVSRVTLHTSVGAVHAGGRVTITAGGLVPGAQYVLTLHSTPVELGRAAAAADGTLSLAATIPTSTPAGRHTITLTAASDPTTVLVSIPFVVAAADPASDAGAGAGRLATTGVDPLPWAVGVAALLLAGTTLLVLRRRGLGRLS